MVIGATADVVARVGLEVPGPQAFFWLFGFRVWGLGFGV